MAVSPIDARPMDWDELLYEFPVAGRDLDITLLGGEMELLRGPMGRVARVADDVLFVPELLVCRRAGRATEYRNPVGAAWQLRLSLTGNRALLLPDNSVVVVGASSFQVCRICVPGDNVLCTPSLTGAVSD